jgi:hypothetical protein
MRIQIKLKHAEIVKAIREYVENNSNLVSNDGLSEEAVVSIFDDGANEFAAMVSVEENTLP